MSLVQLSTYSGLLRTPVHQYNPPNFLETDLTDNQRVVQIEWRRGFEGRDRKTVDWTYTLWIETRL